MNKDLVPVYELVVSQGILIASLAAMFTPLVVWEGEDDFSINHIQCKLYKGDMLLPMDSFCGYSLEEFDSLHGKGNLLGLQKFAMARNLIIALHFFAMFNWLLTWIYPRLQFWRVLSLYLVQTLGVALVVNLETFLLSTDNDPQVYGRMRMRNVGSYASIIFSITMTSLLLGVYTYRIRRYGNIYK